MKIKLTNGTELSPIVVTGSHRMTQGIVRDTLSFVFPADADLNELDAIFTAENCENIVLTGDDGSEYIHKCYTVRAELKREPVMVQPATEETEAVYEDRVSVSMAQRTAQENQVAAMAAAMNALLNGEG